MKRLLLCLTLFLGSPASAETLSHVVLSAENEKKVQAGEIVILNQPNGRIMVVGMINASPERVFDVYSDFDNYEASFGLPEARILERSGNALTGRFGVELPWPVGRRWARCAIKVDPDQYAFDYHRLEGTFAEYDGELKIIPEGPQKSRVLYAARMDPGVPIPSWMVDWVKQRQFRDIVVNVRNWLKRKG